MPDPIQEPLAELLVRAGADIVIGSHAHVLLGAGYLGTAFVDYGLGNFAFYNDPSPTNVSGALAVTVTGRHIDAYSWRPADHRGRAARCRSGAPRRARSRRASSAARALHGPDRAPDGPAHLIARAEDRASWSLTARAPKSHAWWASRKDRAAS